MSDGKNFVKLRAVDQTPEERLSVLEEKIPVLITRIQSYDKILDDSYLLKAKQESLEKEIFSISDKISKIIKKIDGIKLDAEDRVSVAYQRINEAQNNILTLYANYQNLYSKTEKENESQCNQINLSKELSKKLHENSLSKADFNEKILQIESIITSLQKESDENECKINSQKELNFSFINKIEVLDKKNCELDNKLSKSSQEIECLSKKIKDLEENILSKIREKFNDIQALMESQFESMCTNLIPPGTSLKEVKSDFDQKLESFRLDLSNSYLAVKVNERQAVILEKKLENIYLLLKKHELS